jgi:UDP-glucuronate decarboxylase
MISKIVKEDINNIFTRLTIEERQIFMNKNIFITGFAGSLGYMILEFFKEYAKDLGINKIYGIDNYVFGKPAWLQDFQTDSRFSLVEADITNCDLEFAKDAQIIFHMASLASPVYYRQHPIETIDADVIGLRRLLDFYKDKTIHDLLFFSTSEIYGNPLNEQVPTKENYFGNVNTSGPRACYDESKRFGETLCYNFNKQYNMPVTVIRPFNSFGPGLRTNDQRVVADFAKNILDKEDIVIYSDGKATRTFCYVGDTILGILKCVLYGKYEVFNIGSDHEEITIKDLAIKYREVGEKLFDYKGTITYKIHTDKHYLTDNPQRRCPELNKARSILGYTAENVASVGIERYLLHLLEEKGTEL